MAKFAFCLWFSDGQGWGEVVQTWPYWPSVFVGLPARGRGSCYRFGLVCVCVRGDLASLMLCLLLFVCVSDCLIPYLFVSVYILVCL